MKIEIVEMNGLYYVVKDGVTVSYGGMNTSPAEYKLYIEAKKKYDEVVKFYSTLNPKGKVINSIEL